VVTLTQEGRPRSVCISLASGAAHSLGASSCEHLATSGADIERRFLGVVCSRSPRGAGIRLRRLRYIVG